MSLPVVTALPFSKFKSTVMGSALLLCGLIGCKEAEESPSPAVAASKSLTLIDSFPLAIREPSGLSLSKDGRSLWAVSDNDGRAYEIDLQGKILRSFRTGHQDLEGIAAIDGETLAFIAERTREIVITTTDGQVLRRGTIELEGSVNKGPEALTCDQDLEVFHLMQEKPGLLITLDSQLREIARRELAFAKDYAGIFFEPQRQHFWILSDESKTIHVLDTNFEVQTSFSVNIEQMEGIAVDHEKQLVYVVSDPLAKLYVFRFAEY